MWQMGKSLLMSGLGKLGLAGGGVAAIGVGDAALNGPDSWAGRLLESGSNTVKNVDRITDMDGAFTGFARAIQNLIKLVKNFGGIVSGTVNLNTLFTDETPVSTSLSDVTPGGAAPGTTPSMPNGVTPENTISISNLSDGLSAEALTVENALHKTNVFAHGAAEGVVHAVSLVGHAYDAADTVVGWGMGIVGAREWYGDQERDASQWMHEGLMDNVVNSAWEKIGGGVPELNTAWDRAVHFGGELGGAALTGYGLASKFATAAAPAVNTGITASSRLGDAARLAFTASRQPITPSSAAVGTAGWGVSLNQPVMQ